MWNSRNPDACQRQRHIAWEDSPFHIHVSTKKRKRLFHYELFDFIDFRPSLEFYSDVQNLTRLDDLEFKDKLLIAEDVGKNKGQCDEEYSACLISIVDIFSIKYIIWTLKISYSIVTKLE